VKSWNAIIPREMSAKSSKTTIPACMIIKASHATGRRRRWRESGAKSSSASSAPQVSAASDQPGSASTHWTSAVSRASAPASRRESALPLRQLGLASLVPE
jgi:hypothetical protein